MYALLALGFTMVYGIIELINFAHFNVFMVGSFVALWVLQAMGFTGQSHLALRPAADRRAAARALSSPCWAPALLGALIERLALRAAAQRVGHGADDHHHRPVLHPVQRRSCSAPAPTPRTTPIPCRRCAGRSARRCCGCARCWSGRVSIVPDAGLHFFVRRTKMGKAMQATAQDQEAARMMGVDVDRVVIITFFLGSALAGAAGLIFGLYYNYTSFIIGYTAGPARLHRGGARRHRQHPGRHARRHPDRADRVARRPVHRGALDRRHHLLDPGSGAGVPADRASRARRAEPKS